MAMKLGLQLDEGHFQVYVNHGVQGPYFGSFTTRKIAKMCQNDDYKTFIKTFSLHGHETWFIGISV